MEEYIIHSWGFPNIIEERYKDYNFKKENETIQGMLYYLGVCNYIKNIKKAKKLLGIGISKGNSYAMTTVGYIYLFDSENNFYSKAIKLFKKAMELENSYAINAYGYMYDLGIGIERDKEKAIKLYEQAIELGNSYAMINLSHCYMDNNDEDNINKAKQLCEQAVKLGNIDALIYLARMYIYDNVNIVVNKEKAIELYEKSYEMGNQIIDEYYIDIINIRQKIKELILLKKENKKLKNENNKLKDEIKEYVEHEAFKPESYGMKMAKERYKSLCEEFLIKK